MNVETILEYIAFSGSLASAFLYGRKGLKGPLAGIFTCLCFFAWGLTAGVYAAVFSNVVFLIIHGRNLKMAHEENPLVIKQRTKQDVSRLVKICHEASLNAGWWHKLNGDPLPIDVPLKLCLIHSEISEALEADRKDKMDDKLPHRKGIEVELADAIIRICDLAGRLELDLGGAIAEKIEFNALRPDHKIENRQKGGGKKY